MILIKRINNKIKYLNFNDSRIKSLKIKQKAAGIAKKGTDKANIYQRKKNCSTLREMVEYSNEDDDKLIVAGMAVMDSYAENKFSNEGTGINIEFVPSDNISYLIHGSNKLEFKKEIHN